MSKIRLNSVAQELQCCPMAQRLAVQVPLHLSLAINCSQGGWQPPIGVCEGKGELEASRNSVGAGKWHASAVHVLICFTTVSL